MKRRGFSLIEMMSSMVIVSLVFLGLGAMLVNGMKGFSRSSNDITVTNANAQNMRRITDALRGAMGVNINGTGTQITFSYPKLSTTTDPVTGEKEQIIPVTSDGVLRSYTVDFAAGTLKDQNNRILVKNIISTDPQVGSSQYGQAYCPFNYSIIGGQQAVTINLITQTGLNSYKRYQRFKTTVFLRS
ncbi:MAG: prepilin-type N-terminal cleavage/methylation domain-containing protein [Armatimonadetes bacterium]|nr:prepilin-type N-terminal cleavage/methylation domain-containing protein [Armatimonadota bacterium]